MVCSAATITEQCAGCVIEVQVSEQLLDFDHSVPRTNTFRASYKFKWSFVKGYQEIDGPWKTFIHMPEIQPPISTPLTKQKTHDLIRSVFLLPLCRLRCFGDDNNAPDSNYIREMLCTGGLAVTLRFYDEQLDLGQVSLLAPYMSFLFKGQFGGVIPVYTYFFLVQSFF